MNTYEAIIGLEIHAQLLTQSKAFCADSTTFGDEPNTNVSAISLGHPGTLPKLNKKAVELAIKMGLATHCKIDRQCYFARKNYFYPDLPKGYQITQDKTPICTDGYIEVKVGQTLKKIGIQRIHLEEDAGKSIHDQDPFDTLIDLNRAGVPLIEIVSKPDMRSAQEAGAYISEIRKIVRYLDICDGNMEEGSLRCDVNVSVRLQGESTFRTRCEIKNLNSIRNVERAIEYEIQRQIQIYQAGGIVEQETRNFDPISGTTSAMRTKETAHDYRYFPEPDLLPLQIDEEYIRQIAAALPALPAQRYEKYIREFNLSDFEATTITEQKEISDYFEALVKASNHPKQAANWVMGPIKTYLNETATSITKFPLTPPQVAQIIELILQNKISTTAAKEVVFPQMIKHPQLTALEIATQHNVIQQSDTQAIKPLIEEIIQKFPAQVQEYKKGKKGVLGFLVGQVMKASGGKANPKIVNQMMQEALQ
ncbi:MAG: Asp-tRNA(Asn)/Glu-tRNA(Gln) amidotransferase subunit GatB [Bacteroidia bacterium]|nr:Asp-tRNA(Asn)/Glu-tRNA(Gln) amidotransferase subunit GatB [Bacteroidia bacterium]MDW8301528.1 Asp-tRNA(Asn)/Glu-tRNA(Gln) amidotransferase subunit GatB [Bacteroidia bacterium]